jgi:hypothetical protein
LALVRCPEELKPEEHESLRRLQAVCPLVVIGRELVQQFVAIV